jgi:K+-sensing histidine kinase KdpD
MDHLAKTPSQSFKPQTNEQRRRKITKALYKASVKELAVARTATTISDAIVQRIEKCLQRANHKTTPKLEAKAAFNRASRLMQQHNVSQADVLARASSATQQEHAGQSVVSIRRADGSPRMVSRQEFAEHIAYAMEKFFDCKSYSSKKLASMEWTFYGIAENTVTAAIYLRVGETDLYAWQKKK